MMFILQIFNYTICFYLLIYSQRKYLFNFLFILFYFIYSFTQYIYFNSLFISYNYLFLVIIIIDLFID